MTHQQSLHQLRESEKTRLESALISSRNTVKIQPSGFVVATDVGNRVIVVQLSLEKLLVMQNEIAAAILHAKLDDTQPETLRSIPIGG
jgi:hypothetical protein